MPKCKFCKEEINIEIEEYIKHSKRYQHVECLRRHLISRKRARMTEDEADRYVEEIRREFEGEKRENEAKDELYKIIMKRSNVNYLPKRLYIKIANIVNGSYAKFRGSVSYVELVELYNKLGNFLTKQCYNNNIKREQSFDYELSIVLSSVTKYRIWKDKQEVVDNEVVEVVEIVKKKEKINTNNKLTEEEDIFNG